MGHLIWRVPFNFIIQNLLQFIHCIYIKFVKWLYQELIMGSSCWSWRFPKGLQIKEKMYFSMTKNMDLYMSKSEILKEKTKCPGATYSI